MVFSANDFSFLTLCSSWWLEKVIPLEQFSLVLDNVQLTRQSGEAGLKPCV